jgi:glucosamine kinase
VRVSYFLGIDGGGSQTTCVLGDESKVLASVTVGGSNIVRLGERQARAALEQGVREVCKAAAIKPAQIAAVCAGIAGAAREQNRAQIAGILSKLVGAQVAVVGDMEIAHQAALNGAPGIVVISGTGSIAYGRDASGHAARAGGWGFAISDKGSGHWIGVQAVAAVADARDAGTCTKLSDCILETWHLASYDELMQQANASPAPNFAALFPDVLAAAEAGDAAARDLLTRAGVELAGLAVVVFRRLWKPGDSITLAQAGGVFENSPTVRDSFQRELKNSIPQAEILLSLARAAEGALAMARKVNSSSA